MAQADYKSFVDRMIQRYEGKYGWDRADPGGPTNFGITCFDLAQHRGQKMDSMVRWAPIVKAMPLSEAEDIYQTKYATACRFDDLAPGKDCAVFDYGVNSGPGRPIAAARALLHLPGPTKFDDALAAAINASPSFVADLCAERLAFMHRIRGGAAWASFGKGWGARVADLERYCTALAAGTQEAHDTAPDLSAVPTPKAIADDESWADVFADLVPATA